MHAVCRRARHRIHARLGQRHTQRHIERQRITRTAFVAIGGDDGQITEARQGFFERANAARTVAVIVTDQNFCQELETRALRQPRNILKGSTVR